MSRSAAFFAVVLTGLVAAGEVSAESGTPAASSPVSPTALASSAPLPPDDAGDECEIHEHESRLREDSGKTFARYLTPHFLVLYERDAEWARGRAALLETTRERFYAACRGAGFRPADLPGRLLCVIFEHEHEFAAYARDVDRVDMSWSRGYYSARTNRVAIFDERTAAIIRQGLAAPIGEANSAVPSATADEGDAPEGARLVLRSAPAEAEGSPAPVESPRQWAGVASEAARIAALNTAKTTHEAAHQLAFNSGLQKRGVMYPLWASEGLATNFEATDLGSPFGPAEDNPARRRNLVAAARGGLRPLSEFVAMARVPAGDADTVIAVYAQAWGVFHFLFNQHPEQMRRYLEALAAMEPGARDEEVLVREFTEAFGDLNGVQKDWDAFVAGLN